MKYVVKTFRDTGDFENFLNEKCISKENIVNIAMNREIVLLVYVEKEDIKHGEWQLIDECSNEGVYCSVCHKKVYRTDYANQKIKSKYCPNCGAIMVDKK